MEEKACEVEEKAPLLEIELPHKVVEEIKGSITFDDAAEKFLSDKIIELYEILSAQIQGVNLIFPLERVEVLSDYFQWKKNPAEGNAPSEVDDGCSFDNTLE